MDRFKFYACGHCGHVSTKIVGATLDDDRGCCGWCSSMGVEARYLDCGPYSRQEFAWLLSCKTAVLAKGDVGEIVDRLIATIAGGFAR